MQLSDFLVNSICEQAYYQVVNSFGYYAFSEYPTEFVIYVADKFRDITRSQVNYRISESQFAIVRKWDSKIEFAAREWFEKNVEQPREEEKRARKQREKQEQEEREEEERRMRQQQQIELEEEQQRRKSKEEAERKEKAEKEAKLIAEAAAKRKSQEEANRKKLEEMHAQWRANHNPAAASPSVDSIPQADTISCPKCGTQLSKGTKFCTSCGEKLLFTCLECGAIIRVSAKFCTNCGIPLKNKST